MSVLESPYDARPTCARCGHDVPHRPTRPTRADGPIGCEPCDGCEHLRSRLRVPTSFRQAHLLLLCKAAELAAGLDEDVVSLQEVAAGLTERLRSNGLLTDDVKPCWGDAVWLVHDLEDWDFMVLHRVLAQPLTARSRREHPVVAGVSLSQRGEAVVRILAG